jgi:EmrB/QacA subfamily drug resistance transporter
LELIMEKRWKVLTITSVGLFMASLDMFIVNVAFPDLAAEFSGTGLATLSWVLNAYAIVFAALLVPAGRLADLIGRKRMFIAGLLVFSTASALSAAAPSVAVLVGARAAQAAGGAMMMPATLGLILPAFPAEQRAVAIGIWSAVGGVAAALGPPIGGLLVQLDWRWIFVVNVPIGIAAAAVANRVLDEVREPGGGTPDLLGAAQLAAGIGLLTLGIVEGPEWGWKDPRIVAALAGSLALVAGFLLRSSRHPAPVVELRLLRVRSFALANLAAAVFFAAFGAMLLSGVLFLTEVWGYSALKAGLSLAPGPLAAAVLSVPSGRLGARIGQRSVIAAGSVLFAGGFVLLLALADRSPDYLGAFLPAWVLGGAGIGMILGTLPAVVTASLPPERLATGTGIFGMSRQLGAAVGVAVLIALLDDPTPAELFAGLQRGWTFALAAGLGTAGLALALGPPAAVPQGRAAPELVSQRAAA